MAERSWPYAGDPMPEDDWEALAGTWQEIGVNVDTNADALKVTPAGGMAVSVAVGSALLAGRAYDNDATLTISSIPTEATLARYDRIVIALNRLTSSAAITRLAGTPGGVPPSLSSPPAGTTYLPLALVLILPGASSIGSDVIADERSWLGGHIRSIISSTTPAVRPGSVIHKRDTGELLLYPTASTNIALLGPGGRRALVPGGYVEVATDQQVVSTNATGADWTDLGGGMTAITCPGKTGVLYRVTAEMYVGWGRGIIGLRRTSDGLTLKTSDETTEGDRCLITRMLVGAGVSFGLKISAKRVGGDTEFQGRASAQDPVWFMVEDLGLR